MSLTVFFAFCILGIDFMIYFFFKLVYGEKRRAKRRRLPPGYYNDGSSRKTIVLPLFRCRAKKPSARYKARPHYACASLTSSRESLGSFLAQLRHCGRG